MQFALPVTVGTKPGIADYLPVPYGLAGFSAPVEEIYPSLIPFLTLGDGKTYSASDGADEVVPGADGMSFKTVNRKWAMRFMRQLGTGDTGKKILGSSGKPRHLVRHGGSENKDKIVNAGGEHAVDGQLYRFVEKSFGDLANFFGRERIWHADQPYKKGEWGFLGDNAKRGYGLPPDPNILGTEMDPVFQTNVEGLSAYRFDVPAVSTMSRYCSPKS